MAYAQSIHHCRSLPHTIRNIGGLPNPDRGLLDFVGYNSIRESHIANKRRPTCDIITSRGCPFSCTFCSVKQPYRTRSAERVLDEMGDLIETYGIREFRVIDDNFAYDKQRALDICNGIVERGYDITWDAPNGLAVATLDEELLVAMKRSGFYKLILGIESGSPRTLKAMRKPVKLDKARELIKICNKLGIWTWSTFIIGYPDETREDIQETVNFIGSIGINMISIFVAQPLIGTEIYEQYDHSKDVAFCNFFNPQYDTKHFTAQELSDMRDAIFKRFFIRRVFRYINPYRFYTEFLTRFRSWEDIKFFVKQLWNFPQVSFKDGPDCLEMLYRTNV